MNGLDRQREVSQLLNEQNSFGIIYYIPHMNVDAQRQGAGQLGSSTLVQHTSTKAKELNLQPILNMSTVWTPGHSGQYKVMLSPKVN